MQKNIDCLIVGYAGVDRIIRIDTPARVGITSIVTNKEHRQVSFGGNGSNIAVCIGKLGCSVYPLMRVGEDWEKLGYRKMLLDSNVDISGIKVIKGETTSICHLIEDTANDHITLTYPGAMDKKYATYAFDEALFKRARYGILSVTTSVDVEQFLDLTAAHELPLVLAMRVDPESFPLPLLKRALHNAEILFTNRVERELIEEAFGFSDITELFERGKAKIIVTTLGKDGSAVYEKTQTGIAATTVKAAQCSSVVDATGAGDSYVAGFMYGLIKGKDAKTCAEYGGTVASFIIEQVGCTTNAPCELRMLERYTQKY